MLESDINLPLIFKKNQYKIDSLNSDKLMILKIIIYYLYFEGNNYQSLYLIVVIIYTVLQTLVLALCVWKCLQGTDGYEVWCPDIEN